MENCSKFDSCFLDFFSFFLFLFLVTLSLVLLLGIEDVSRYSLGARAEGAMVTVCGVVFNSVFCFPLASQLPLNSLSLVTIFFRFSSPPPPPPPPSSLFSITVPSSFSLFPRNWCRAYRREVLRQGRALPQSYEKTFRPRS